MIKYGFDSLTNLQKIQLYLLVPMLLWLVLFVIESGASKSMSHSIQKIDISTIDKMKIVQTTPKEIISFVDERIESYKIVLDSIHIKQELIILQLSGSFERVFNFVQKMQLHLSLVSFKLVNEKDITFHMQVRNKYFFNTNLLEKEFYIQDKNENIQLPQITIDAIIDDEVLLNGIWYKKGAEYNGYKLINIEKSFISLKENTTGKNLKVELVDESL